MSDPLASPTSRQSAPTTLLDSIVRRQPTDWDASGVDEGYFPRGKSMLREVHETRIVGLTYGPRDLLVGSLFPMVAEGVVLNSAVMNSPDPAARLAHTVWVMEQIWFGTRAAADKELRRLYGFHRTVTWSTDEPLASYPPGDYEALMPEFLLAVLMSTADSAEAMYEACVRRLTTEEREALWQDYLLMGELFGLPRSAAPQTYGEYRALLGAHLASDNAFMIEAGLRNQSAVDSDAYSMVLRPPVPKVAVPLRNTLMLLVVGTLPQRVRELHNIPWTARQQRRFDTLTAGLRLASRATPTPIRSGRSTPFFNLIAKAEQRMLRHRSASDSGKTTSGGCPFPTGKG